jgi:hypothetical protein
MSKHRYKSYSYNNSYNEIKESEVAKQGFKRHITKRNTVFVLIAIFIGYSFILFAYSNINPFGTDHQYTNINTIPSYWLDAMQFLNQTKYQYNISIFKQNSTQINYNGSYVLSWWDYGDWINWFGQSKTVLRGDNQVPSLDYATAYQFINGNATTLASFMKQEHAKLWLISSDDFEKIAALSYLSCIYQNETNTQTPLGSSECEKLNSPTYLFFPQNQSNINNYCTMSNSTTLYIKAESTYGVGYCLQSIQTTNQGMQLDGKVYTLNGTIINNTNIMPITAEPISGQTFEVYLLLYTPLNTTTCQMPTGLPRFYYSNLYMGEFMGCMGSQFQQVYPTNGAFGNVRIYKLVS